MAKKNFELAVLLSLLNNGTLLNVTEQQIEELIQHVVGERAFERDYAESFDAAIDYIKKNHPKIAEAARLVEYNSPDQARYNKLIDLYRKNHEIATMADTVGYSVNEEDVETQF